MRYSRPSKKPPPATAPNEIANHGDQQLNVGTSIAPAPTEIDLSAL
jgi:hypothetical protein